MFSAIGSHLKQTAVRLQSKILLFVRGTANSYTEERQILPLALADRERSQRGAVKKSRKVYRTNIARVYQKTPTFLILEVLLSSMSGLISVINHLSENKAGK